MLSIYHVYLVQPEHEDAVAPARGPVHQSRCRHPVLGPLPQHGNRLFQRINPHFSRAGHLDPAPGPLRHLSKPACGVQMYIGMFLVFALVTRQNIEVNATLTIENACEGRRAESAGEL